MNYEMQMYSQSYKPKNHMVKFLVSEDQFVRIKNNTYAKGHKTISGYLRDLALNRDLRYETMLIEIHKEVVQNERTNNRSGNTRMG